MAGRITVALFAFFVLCAALVLAGCGGSSASKSTTVPATTAGATTTATPPPATPATTTSAPQVPSPGALQPEANSTATGDIPDNQVFLVFRNAPAGWSMKYPEGWAQSGSGKRIAFRDKNNIVRVVVVPGSAPTPATVRRDLAKLGVHVQGAPQQLTLPSGPALKVVYTTVSAPNPVTGKRVTLAVDRYYVSPRGGKLAIVDLGTPQGVDNVDAYRLMIQSFRWR